MNNTMKAAVNYAALGWSVIPLKPNSKSPLIPWLEYQKRLPTMEELRNWFENTQNNLGIVTGSLSQLSVVDADDLTHFLAQAPIHSPISAMTPRPGKHFYFRYSGETNSASKIADHIDVRGEGGYVVAPPSVVDGHRYRFLNNYLNPSLLPDFPRELLDVSIKAVNGGMAVKPQKSQDWLSQALEGIREGNRNATFTSIVGRLHRDRYSPNSIRSLLLPHAKDNLFDLGELDNVIQSVTRYENQKEGGSGTGYEIHGSDNKAENIEDFLKGEEHVEWIVPGVIAKSSLGFIAGLPESLKTWILIDLAIEASQGGEWLGYKVNPCKVLFIDQERWVGETRRRFRKLLKGKVMKTNSENKDLLHIQVGSSIRLNLDASFEAFRKKLSELRPGLIIVDSFATFSTVAENDRQEVQKVLERLKQLRQEFGCTILMIDHEGKSVVNPDNKDAMPTAFTMVGSVAKPAAAESVFTVRRASDSSVTVYHTKSTLGSAIPPVTVMLVDTEDEGIRLVKL